MQLVHTHSRRHQARRRAGGSELRIQRRRMTHLIDPSVAVDRRSFIKVGAAVGGGLLISTYVPFGEALAATVSATADNFAPNAFITITPAGAVTIIAPN